MQSFTSLVRWDEATRHRWTEATRHRWTEATRHLWEKLIPRAIQLSSWERKGYHRG